MIPGLLLAYFSAMRSETAAASVDSQALDIAVADRQGNLLAAYNPGAFAAGWRELGGLFGGAR